MADVPVRVVHAIHLPLALGGVGSIAEAEVRGLLAEGLLAHAFAPACADGAVPADKLTRVLPARLFRAERRRARVFDRCVAALLPSCELLLSWSLPSSASVRRARRRGARTIVVNASTHPEHQDEVLRAEHARFRVPDGRDPRILRDRLAQLAEADLILVPSAQAEASFLARGVAPSRLACIPFGVDLTRFAAPEPPGAFRVLFVGQVSLRKGVQYLLPAFERLRSPDKELVLVGPVQRGLEALVGETAARNAGRVRLAGLQRETADEYRRASVCVFPSIEEGSALVSYEAMAASRASVVTPELGSLVEHGVSGLVVPARDVEALAAALQRLHDEPELRSRYGRAARAAVEDRPWERYGREVAAHCRRVVGS